MSPGDVAHGMTSQRVSGEQYHVAQQHEGADADAERLLAGDGIGEPEGLVDVIAQHQQEQERNVQEVAMDILHDQREGGLSPVSSAGLADRARGRIRPERLVVGAAVVVAGDPEDPGKGQDQQSRREDQPARPPGRLRPEPRVRRAAEELRRVEGRKIRSVGIVVALECGPGRVDDEAGEDHEDDRRLHPPSVTAHALAETTPNHRKLGVRHGEAPSACGGLEIDAVAGRMRASRDIRGG